jgi:hypothetical protein
VTFDASRDSRPPLSIYKSSLHGAKRDAANAADSYKDAVLDVTDAQQEAMRMLKTLGPQIERWRQASAVALEFELACVFACFGA